MKLHLELTIVILFASWYSYILGQTNSYDDIFRDLRVLMDVYLKITRPSENVKNIEIAKRINIIQTQLNDSTPFPCSLHNTRSETRPTSVHALRPGDIDVIGAIGDSLTAGNGIVATNLPLILLQNRGLSFSIGGQGTWREYITLPNILKELNPNLIGYSIGDSFVNQAKSQLNVAEALARSPHIPDLSRELVRRIKNDPRINVKQDWKMITIMIGSNDFCSDMCFHENPEIILENPRRYTMEGLKILKDNLPRTIVNLVFSPHLNEVRNVTRINRPPICVFTHFFFCPCLFGERYRHLQDKFDDIMSKWQQIEIEIANDPMFDTDDFTVVGQSFILNYNVKRNRKGLTDYSSLSADCFHLSQKEHARAAMSLWNNLLEPVGNKTSKPMELFNFKCPTEKNPYIFTRRNSI